MSTQAHPGDEAQRTAKQAADSRPVRLLGRVGLVSYGVVHLLVGYLALRVALGDSGSGSTKTDKGGALGTLASQPGGQALLWVITIGLTALVLWQLAEALWGHRSGGNRTAARAASVGEAAVFGFLAFSAGKFAAGGGSSGSGQEALTARILQLPLGQVLLAIVGLAVIVVAGFVVHHGLTKRFLRELDLSRAQSMGARKAAVRLGQVGYTALGIVYGTVGILVIVAAMTIDPSKATGLDVALGALAGQPYGQVLLGAVALGLVCFGVYCLFDARYRKA